MRVPGRVVRPDIVFTSRRLAVFVDGCFWHGCPTHGNQPRANAAYWRPKLARNIARDGAVDEALQAAGWRVLRAWEREPPTVVADRVEEALASLQRQAPPLRRKRDRQVGAPSRSAASEATCVATLSPRRGGTAFPSPNCCSRRVPSHEVVGERHETPQLGDAQPAVVPVKRADPWPGLSLDCRRRRVGDVACAGKTNNANAT